MDNKQTSIIEIVKNEGVINPQAELIINTFAPIADEAQRLIDGAKDIVVKDENDVVNMGIARERRLALQKIRVKADKERKRLKEDATKYNSAVQGVFNIIEKAISKAEDHLETQEKYAENLAKEKAAKIKAERLLELSKYVSDTSVYNLDDMAEEVFANLLAGCKTTWEKEQAELKKIEDEKIEKEKKLSVYKDRQIEFAKYSEFVPDMALTPDTTEEDYQKMLSKGKEGKKVFDANQEEIKKAKEKTEKTLDRMVKLSKYVNNLDQSQVAELSDAEFEKMLASSKKVFDDKEAKRIADEKQAEADKIAKDTKEKEDKRIADEKAEQERQAALAPEKDKLTAYAESIRTLKSPEGLSKAGLEVVKTVEGKLLAISQEIKLKIKEL